MKVAVSNRPIESIAGDVAVQVFRPPCTLKRASLLAYAHPRAERFVVADAGSTTWLESREMACPRLLLVSAGTAADSEQAFGWNGIAGPAERAAMQRHDWRNMGGIVERACYVQDAEHAVIAPGGDAALDALVEGMMLRAYGFVDHRRDDCASTLEQVTVCVSGDAHAEWKRRIAETVVMAETTNQARWLSDLPSNDATPEKIVTLVRTMTKSTGLRMRVLGPKELERLGMGLVLAVARGSANPPRVLLLEHRPTGATKAPTLAFVGKGVTHDTGGYNLKQAASMHELTYDKAAGMAVIGAMLALARLDVKVNVVACIPLVENCVDARAYKPGDIVYAMDGTSVYIENTDAEGRLVLADCLSYVQRHRPQLIVDMGTLTAAASIALGEPFAALFSNDSLARDLLIRAGEDTGELLWPMPIHPTHRALIRHHKADIRNAGVRYGAASSAAAFLRTFVRGPWAHLDIAGKAHAGSDRDLFTRGATGFGCRLLVRAAQQVAAQAAFTQPRKRTAPTGRSTRSATGSSRKTGTRSSA